MIYIVRHGQTDWNKKGIIQGHSDIPLNKQGFKEANELKEKLKNIDFDIVFSSPLKRTYQTASILTDNKIIKDKRLIERYNGLYDGKYKDDIFETIDFSSDEDCSKYNIELFKDIKYRLIEFLKEIKNQNGDKNILIVTHAGVILNIRIIVEKIMNYRDNKNLTIGNCDYIVYDNNEIKLN